MKDLKSLNDRELDEFFDSFDLLLSDVDGVLWLFLESIPGTNKAVSSLKRIGKKVVFVSNNCTKTIDVYHKQLVTAGFDIEREDIVTPVLAMISYLKKINFNKEIYVIGMAALRIELEKAGFKVADKGPDRVKETLQDFAASTVIDVGNVGAVIGDSDVNLNYLKLQRAATYLKNPDVIFITGAPDTKLPVGFSHVVLGPGYFHKVLEDVTGRKAYSLAKPSPNLNDYLVERLKIDDRSRVLFVGDSISEDMGFATKSGYKKLLVLSGLAKKEALSDWKFPEEYKPDFYVDSLKTVHELIEQRFGGHNLCK